MQNKYLLLLIVDGAGFVCWNGKEGFTLKYKTWWAGRNATRSGSATGIKCAVVHATCKWYLYICVHCNNIHSSLYLNENSQVNVLFSLANQQPGTTLTSVVGTDLQVCRFNVSLLNITYSVQQNGDLLYIFSNNIQPAQIQLPVPETQPRGKSRHPLGKWHISKLVLLVLHTWGEWLLFCLCRCGTECFLWCWTHR